MSEEPRPHISAPPAEKYVDPSTGEVSWRTPPFDRQALLDLIAKHDAQDIEALNTQQKCLEKVLLWAARYVDEYEQSTRVYYHCAEMLRGKK